MAKQWTENKFRILEESHAAFIAMQEKKLDADHAGWRPRMPANYESKPINGEYAIPLEEYIKK